MRAPAHKICFLSKTPLLLSILASCAFFSLFAIVPFAQTPFTTSTSSTSSSSVSTSIISNPGATTSTSSISTTSTTSSTTTSTTMIPSMCNQYTPTNGICDVISSAAVSINGNNAGNGALMESTGSVETTPVIANTQEYNSNSNLWLISCPNAPSNNTQQYINYSNNVAGDACLAPSSQVSANVLLNTLVKWDSTNYARASVYLSSPNAANLIVDNIGYSGETFNESDGPQNGIISSGYNSNSQIFNQVPPSTQYGIWSWNARIANLSNTNVNQLEESTGFPTSGSSFSDLSFTNDGCTYDYTYTVSSSVQSIKNSEIPVPVANQQPTGPPYNPSAIKVNNVTYDNIVVDSNPSTDNNANAIDMENCYVPSLSSSWKRVSTNAVVYYESSKYTTCVYQYGNAQQYWSWVSQTSSSNPSGTGPSVSNLEPAYVNINSPNLVNLPAYPYFLYNFSIPSSFSSVDSNVIYLNQSYDIYGSAGLLSPYNSLDPFRLYGISSFLMNYSNRTSMDCQPQVPLIGSELPSISCNGTLTSVYFQNGNASRNNTQIGAQTDEFIIDANAYAASSFGIDVIQSYGKNYTLGKIVDPIYMSESDSNKIFILSDVPYNSASPSNGIGTYLYEVSVLPTGYYNYSALQPESIENSTLSGFDNEWESYWDNVSAVQNNNLYITKMYNLTSYFWSRPISDCTKQSKTTGVGANRKTVYYISCSSVNVLPVSMVSDNAGDVYIVSPNSTVNESGSSGFSIVLITENGSVFSSSSSPGPIGALGTQILHATGTGTIPSDLVSTAISPGGQYLYLASSDDPYIFIYHPDLSFNSTTATTTLNVSYLNAINLSYSTRAENLSITEYLQNGGPFNSSLIEKAYPKEYPAAELPGEAAGYYLGSYTNDTPSNHEPIYITDSDGVIYVFDLWSFAPCSAYSGGSGAYCSRASDDSILMLRAFLSNGTEVHIHPSSFNDTISRSEISLSTGFVQTSPSYPPYGWPLSANFTLWLSNSQSNYYYQSYCSYGCNNSPSYPLSSAMNYSGFPPIGPNIGADPQGGFGYNQQWFYATSDFNSTVYLDAWAYTYPPTSSRPTPPNLNQHLYTEFASIPLNLQNYTKISNSSYSEYQCFIATSKYQSYKNELPTTCDVNQSLEDLFNSTPPDIGIPSSFSYAESLGSPEQYLSAPTLLNALVGGSASGSGSASSGFNSTSSSLVNSTANGTIGAIAALPTINSSYIKSSINGYLLVPVNYTYTIDQSYSPNPDPPVSGSCSAYTFPSLGPQQYNIYSAIPVGTPNNNETHTIQGGSIYAQYVNTRTYYIPNLSDSGTIFPPEIDYNLFLDRILGEIYINQSVSPTEGWLSSGSYLNGPELYVANTTSNMYNLTISADPVVYGSKDTITYTDPGPDLIPSYITIYNDTTGFYEQADTPVTICNNIACISPGIYNVSGCDYGPPLEGCTAYATLKVLPQPKAKELVVNATHNYNYSTYTLTQTSSYGTFPGYSLQEDIPESNVTLGEDCSFCSLEPYYYNAANLFDHPSNISFTSISEINLVQLFEIYRKSVYLNNLYLDLEYGTGILGYNRLNYTYIDLFNNTINMPLDADLANITTIQLNIKSVTNVNNPNSTTININGSAGYYPSIFSATPVPLPADSSIYIYYDTDINFYNSTTSFISDPSAYYQYALQCAFSGSSSCSFANPVYTNQQPLGQGTLGPEESNVTTYNPQYNTTGQCPLEPNSLLLTPSANQCNIYGSFGLKSTETSANGNTLYCIPDYANGTGVFSTQLGLVNVAKTDSNGNFNISFNSCGTGTARIVADYYGWPPPEPGIFFQPALQGGISTAANMLEFNYSISPGSSIQSFPLGSYYLSYNNVEIIIAFAIAAIFIAYALFKKEKR